MHANRISALFAATSLATAAQTALADPAAPVGAGSTPALVSAVRRIDTADAVPARATGAGTTLTIHGLGFVPGLHVEVGPRSITEGLMETRPTEVMLPLPGDLPSGVYAVRVRWPDGTKLCARWPLVIRERTCQLKEIRFRQGSADLEGSEADPSAAGVLTEDAACLARGADRPLLVLGFASREGSSYSNADVSRRRAEAAGSWLRAHLPQSSVQTIGLGDALPVDLKDDEPGRARSRRVVVVAGKPPCQAVRLPLGAEGSFAGAPRGLLESAVQCFAERSVTSLLVVLPIPAERAAAADAAELTKTLAARAPSGADGPLVQVVYAGLKDRETIGRVLGAANQAPAEDSVDIYPIGWFSASSAFQTIESNDPSCPYESAVPATPSSVSAPPSWKPPTVSGAPPVRPAEAFAQLRFGGMRALEQTHVGGTIRAGRTVVHFGAQRRTSILIGASLGMFGGNEEYMLGGDLRSRFLFQLHAAAGVTHRLGPLRLEATLLPGVLLPAAGAFFADAEGTVAWRIAEGAELLGTFGGGTSIWRGAAMDVHWFAETGMGWWFR